MAIVLGRTRSDTCHVRGVDLSPLQNMALTYDMMMKEAIPWHFGFDRDGVATAMAEDKAAQFTSLHARMTALLQQVPFPDERDRVQQYTDMLCNVLMFLCGPRSATAEDSGFTIWSNKFGEKCKKMSKSSCHFK